MAEFYKLGINEKLSNALALEGIHSPTPIQNKSIPPLLDGMDVIAKAQTGTGKTLAFLLPIIEKVNPEKDNVQALIIAPTRELAVQITSEAKKLASVIEGMNVLAVYGGQDVEAQIHRLQGAMHIVIGTPGRLLDHIRRGTLDLSSLNILVLDEADQMLHIGFLTEVESIIEQTPDQRQTAMFSATISPEVRSLANKYLRNPIDIQIKNKNITVKEIRQLVIETTDRAKQATLCRLINEYHPFLAIIFCRTKRRASKLNESMRGQGYLTEELHGDLSQAKREQVMKDFREGKIHLLIATDVAARGLDVEGVTHVFNYDIPHDAESYIHRIGRTGRAGNKGLAVTLVAPKDKGFLESIEKAIGFRIDKQSLVNEKVKTRKQFR